MRFTVKVEWQQDDGTVATAELGELHAGWLRSATDLGLKLSEGKPALTRLQNIVAATQVSSYCESVRECPSCRVPRRIKDYRERKLDSVFGTLSLTAPRFERCQACDRAGVLSPLTKLLPTRALPELGHLQAELAAELPYARAAAILQKFVPSTGGLSAVTTRNRTLAVGKRIERELIGEVEAPMPIVNPAKHLTVGIDGALVKAKRDEAGGRPFEILTGRVERDRGEVTPSRLSGTWTHGRSRRFKPFFDGVAAALRPASRYCRMAKTDCVEWSAGLARTATTCWTGPIFAAGSTNSYASCSISPIVRTFVTFSLCMGEIWIA